MKKILQKFSPEISSELVGERLEETFEYPNKAQKVFDLHGFYKSEISGKLDFIWNFCQHKNYCRIKIITGKGKLILFSEVKRLLSLKKKQEYCIYHFSHDEGSFEIFLSPNFSLH